MVMLGDILGAARDRAPHFETWLRESDPEFASQVGSAATAADMTPGAYVRMAVADFARHANEEDWATLTSTLRNDADPGTACLLAMVHWRLHVSACAQHVSRGVESS